MKSRYILTFALLLFAYAGFSQDSLKSHTADSTKYKYLQKVNVIRSQKSMHDQSQVKLKYTNPEIRYRPTRLGSSSPLYNTYTKNKRGAGAITTNPNKSGGSSFPNETTPAEEYLLHRVDSSSNHH